MGRFHYVRVIGSYDRARVRAIIVKDTETGFLFFVSKDHRLHDAGWVFGGIPISMCPDENYWNDVCRYTLGTKELDDFESALMNCGCGMLNQFTDWRYDDDGEEYECDELTTAQMDALLNPTISIGWTGPIPLRPNTDYECATQVYPWRTGSDRVGSSGGEERGSSSGGSGSSGSRRSPIPGHLDDIISENYTRERTYSGMGSYHAHHGQTPNRAVNGYGDEGYMVGVELEVECKSESAKDTLNETRSNWFYQEHDGSLGEYGVELITIPLRPVDARSVDFWKTLCDPVGKVATSWENSTTGLHVHISRTILGSTPAESSETLGKLLYFYHHLVLDGGVAERINKDIYGRAHTYSECIGKSDAGSAAKTLGKSALKHRDVCDVVKVKMIEKSSRDRYFDINLQNSDTIEFRKGKGSIKPERLAMVVAWSELMCLYCRETKWEDLSFDSFRSYVRDSALTPACLKERV